MANFVVIGAIGATRADICSSLSANTLRALPSVTSNLIDEPFTPPTSVTWVSFHPPRVFSQKIAAVTDCGPSVDGVFARKDPSRFSHADGGGRGRG